MPDLPSPTVTAMPQVDIDSLVAIDVHTHAETSEITGCGAISLEFQEAVDRYFGGQNTLITSTFPGTSSSVSFGQPTWDISGCQPRVLSQTT